MRCLLNNRITEGLPYSELLTVGVHLILIRDFHIKLNRPVLRWMRYADVSRFALFVISTFIVSWYILLDIE